MAPSKREQRGGKPEHLERLSPSEVRRRILDLTVQSLAQRGYAATTTVQVQADANVSRGRLLHYFPSREDLLVAALGRLAEERFAAIRAVPLPEQGRVRLRELLRMLWQSFDGILHWANIEMWVASRHDPKLAERLRAEERRLFRVQRDAWNEVFGPELTSHPDYEIYRDTVLHSMRGLAMTYTFDPRPLEEEPQLDVWLQLGCRVFGIAPD